MNTRPRVSVIIPCRNEELSISGVVRAVQLPDAEIVVVDNASDDATAEISRQAGARVIYEPIPGYGSAVRAGLRSATGDIIALLDGDGQHPAGELSHALALIESGADFVTCVRIDTEHASFSDRVRGFGNTVLTSVINARLGITMRDSQSGMMVFKRALIDEPSLQGRLTELPQELKMRAHRSGARYVEHEVSFAPRRSGSSKLRPFRHGLRNLRHALTGIIHQPA